MTLTRSLTALAALLLIWSGSAMAAKNAFVTGAADGSGGGAVLRSSPLAESQALATLPIGSSITISNYPTNGYYKARTPSGQLGWIAVTSVGSAPPPSQPTTTTQSSNQLPSPSAAVPPSTPTPSQELSQPPVSQSQAPPQTPPRIPEASSGEALPLPPDSSSPTSPSQTQPETETETIPYQDVPSTENETVEESSESQPRGPRLPFEIKVFDGVQSLLSTITFSQAGVSLYSSMPYYGVQFGLPVSDRLFILLRIEHLSKSSSQAGYAFSLSSTPVTAGLSYSFLPMDSGVRLRGSLLMGVALATTLDVTASSQPTPNLSELETQAFTEMLKADFEVPVSRKFALYAEGGYRFLNSSSIGPSPPVNGSSIFQQGGNTVPIPLNLSGFFFGGGLAIYL